MCEYCGCQSLPAIAQLTAEHDQVLDLVFQVRAADKRGNIEEMIELCRKLVVVLGPHTLVEERGLFPAMTADFPDQIATLEDEHRRIELVLDEARGVTARVDPAWPARLIDVLSLLSRHIFKEQDGVFPAALSTLSNAQWDRVGDERAAVAAALPPR